LQLQIPDFVSQANRGTKNACQHGGSLAAPTFAIGMQ
jgi:hypothetical protein